VTLQYVHLTTMVNYDLFHKRIILSSSVIANPLRLRSSCGTKVRRGPVIMDNRGTEGGKSMHVHTYSKKYNFLVVTFVNKYYHDLGVTLDWDWKLQVFTELSLNPTHYKSPQHQLRLFPACCVFNSRSLATALIAEILQLHTLRFYLHRLPCRTQLTIGSPKLSSL
jgi:hypothetical protein